MFLIIQNQFEQLFLSRIHCLFRPPTSIKIFDLNDLQKITKYVQSTFYRHYKMYIFAFTPFVNVEIRTHQMFKSRFPISDSLQDAVEIPRAQVELLNQYLLDQETGLTPEQLEEIMRGDSIHMVPAKKRQEWLRQREERERKEKIDRVLKKELEKLEQDFQDKMQKQDDQYLQQVQSIKNPPKKK
ncbi:hypothetical protein PPERSA_12682 [Pseudocohnilembus persalinus]|uniref:Uncharacterized protein n=1 Tax=Pseudocohnilembus persalinus TaxID=266149 RepID=A0A0V0QNL4_PSEPJ|nr:hypothetical protein PPERSA_12682 [Pseudocohnilembus persalinus]|eukprot:KRX03552.1 hypothetical protein PPERSA_12682 [Pseudocohnilembus persalinus]